MAAGSVCFGSAVLVVTVKIIVDSSQINILTVAVIAASYISYIVVLFLASLFESNYLSGDFFILDSFCQTYFIYFFVASVTFLIELGLKTIN